LEAVLVRRCVEGARKGTVEGAASCLQEVKAVGLRAAVESMEKQLLCCWPMDAFWTADSVLGVNTLLNNLEKNILVIYTSKTW